ncbi:MAG: hypothetical protein AAFY68_03430 [Pseudomonadota bacterium]
MAILLFSLHSVSAQDVIGRGLADGREIIILEDNTWRFADPTLRGCDDLTDWLSFCGNISAWVPFETNDDQMWAYQYGGYEYGFVIIYNVGRNDGFGATDLIFAHYEGHLDSQASDMTELDYLGGYTFGDGAEDAFVATFTYEIRGGYSVTAAVSELQFDEVTALLITETDFDHFSPAHEYLHETFVGLFDVYR